MNEHVGSPDPAGMVRQLQAVVYGESYATSWPPAEEWQRLLDRVAELSGTEPVSTPVLHLPPPPVARLPHERTPYERGAWEGYKQACDWFVAHWISPGDPCDIAAGGGEAEATKETPGNDPP